MSDRPPAPWPYEPEQYGPFPFCNCFRDKNFLSADVPPCRHGEDPEKREWYWESPPAPTDGGRPKILMADRNTEVTFHPYYSNGTAVAKGATQFNPEFVYYWEVKMMTDPYGTDIMIGVGTDEVDVNESIFRFRSFLGYDDQSYGLSYAGQVCHNSEVAYETIGFGRGTIVGVKVDMGQGTLEFFINRRGLGVSFNTLRRHPVLFPMICSTAAQSVMRLVYAASYKFSLLTTVGKILADSMRRRDYFGLLPPGLQTTISEYFFIALPSLNVMEVEYAEEPAPSSWGERAQYGNF
ncbi:SPRY domain-containing SOCS box protein 3-like [Anticarsia gemmatalis]|uniref:SPRY domain-containing SOCS box protein 3-like n=1 Tax=Anticarsia gemmatalis TaxID=129554 RepID=UPI003F758A5D